MPTIEQRWLSLSGICTTLNLRPSQIKTLYNQKLLVRIGKRPEEHRYLDPTPEYAERLRLAASMLTKNSYVPRDVNFTFMLTRQEVAQILGKGVNQTQKWLSASKIPSFKSKSRVVFYSVDEVRKMVWRRNGRKLGDRTAPFLLAELLTYFKRYMVTENTIMPNDSQFKEDQALQAKLEWMMRQKNRDVMLSDFLQKLELTKAIVLASHSQDGTSTDNQK